MKFKNGLILIVFALFFFAKTEKIMATHIVGGELSYRFLSNDSNGNFIYEITLKIYRDCFNGIPNFDNPTFLYVFDGQNNYLGYVPLIQKKITGDTLPLISPDSCRLPPTDICVEEKIMTDTIPLPYKKDGYLFAYQRCCRNNSILNIINPDIIGTTYTQHLMMDSTIAPINSSPYFKNFPPIFICNEVNLKFDHSAIDPDGDSLVYELCTPYNGADTLIPWPTPNIIVYTPPFDTVKFKSPYNVNNQLGGSEAMKIDPVTGLLTAKPSQIGQYVVGICVKEFRNGVLLDIHRRDFQFNVTDCREKPQAVIPEVIVQCRGDLSVAFKNLSIGAVSYLWDFGDPSSTLLNTSTAKNPTHQFTALGTYTVTLISNPTLDCSDTAIAKVNVYNKITGADFDMSDHCLNTITMLHDKSVLSEGFPNKWKWTINLNPNDTLIKKDTSYYFTTLGTNYVKLKVTNENGCMDSITKPLEIFPIPFVKASGDTIMCNDDSAQLFANGADNYLWTPSNTLTCSNCPNPLAKPPVDTKYFVNTTNAFNCTTKDSIVVKVKPVKNPKANFTLKDLCLGSLTLLKDQSIISVGTPTYWKWTIDNNPKDTLINQDTRYLFKKLGPHAVKLKVTNVYGCADSISKSLEINPNPFFNLFGDTLICPGTGAKLNAVGANNYSWTPTNTLSCSNCSNTISTPISNTTYVVNSTNQYNCSMKDSITVKIRPTLIPIPDLLVSTGRCVPATIDMKGFYSNIDSVCGNTKNWKWEFGDGQTSTHRDTSHTYTQAGTYLISLQFNNSEKVYKTITLLPVDSCGKRIFVPNVFTPNGDGTNEKVYLRGINIKKADFRIYNRWGEEMFQTNDISIGWDGTYKGQKLTPQVVVYTANVTYWDETTEKKEGNISLVE